MRPSPRPRPRPDRSSTSSEGPTTIELQDPDGRARGDAADPRRTDPAAAGSFGARIRSGLPVNTWLAALLAFAVVALVVLNILLAGYYKSTNISQDRERVLAAAKSAVPVILSYNYQHFDADVVAAGNLLTGRARTDYQQAMSATIKPGALKIKAVVEAQVDTAGIESVSGNGQQVAVLVYGQQKVTSTNVSAPRTDPFRVRAILDRVGGKWLVSKFDQV
jgi:Mce-associated membrane protein